MVDKVYKVIVVVMALALVAGLILGAILLPKVIAQAAEAAAIAGPVGNQGVAGPQGPAGENADPAEVLALMQRDPSFLLSVKQELSAPTINNPYMTAYEDSLEYVVPAELQVPSDLLEGFIPVASLVKTDLMVNDKKVAVSAVPADITPYFCFPQDYSNGDQSNPGCRQAQLAGSLPWKRAVAGYNDGNNWSSDSPDGWSADDIQSYNWRVITGYEVCHPAVGCLKDPDGGAVMIILINFEDSDEVWSVRNQSAIFVDAGFIGYGPMWDLSGGTYDIGEGIADIRNHYLYNLGYPVSAADNHLEGQCGDSGLCKTVTYVTVARVWDRSDLGINFSHFELLDYGQWVRPE